MSHSVPSVSRTGLNTQCPSEERGEIDDKDSVKKPERAVQVRPTKPSLRERTYRTKSNRSRSMRPRMGGGEQLGMW